MAWGMHTLIVATKRKAERMIRSKRLEKRIQLGYTVSVFFGALALLVSLSACGHDDKFYRVSEYTPSQGAANPSVAVNDETGTDDATGTDGEYPDETPIDDADDASDDETDIGDVADGTPEDKDDKPGTPIDDAAKGCLKNPKAHKHCKL